MNTKYPVLSPYFGTHTNRIVLSLDQVCWETLINISVNNRDVVEEYMSNIFQRLTLEDIILNEI
jgi:hypothetical protein